LHLCSIHLERSADIVVVGIITPLSIPVPANASLHFDLLLLLELPLRVIPAECALQLPHLIAFIRLIINFASSFTIIAILEQEALGIIGFDSEFIVSLMLQLVLLHLLDVVVVETTDHAWLSGFFVGLGQFFAGDVVHVLLHLLLLLDFFVGGFHVCGGRQLTTANATL
jgi:hypothetical protein